MGISLVTAATTDPVRVSDCSPDILDFSGNQEANLRLESAISFATRWLEEATQRQLMSATWKQTFDDWPGDGRFKIDVSPLSSVTTLKYYDADASLTTVSSADYWTITDTFPPFVQMKPDYDYPTLEDSRPGAIELTYVAGHTSIDDVPKLAKKGIMLLAALFYRVAEAQPVPDSADLAAVTPNDKIPAAVWSIVNMLKRDGYT